MSQTIDAPPAGSVQPKGYNNDQDRAKEAFQITKQELVALVNAYACRVYDEELLKIDEHGGYESLCNKLKVDPKVGLTGHDFAERTEKFGNNYRPEPVAKSWFSLFIGALDDQMLKLLIVCAVFSITFDMILAEAHERSHAWIEGTAIALAVFIVASVGSFVDWRKEIQFIKSRKETNSKNVCRVLRNGVLETLHHNDLHVGDVIMVEYGMNIPVDGLCFQAVQLTCDESAMTGESVELKKDTVIACKTRKAEIAAEQPKHVAPNDKDKERRHLLPSPIMQSGTSVAGGEGKMITLMVGDDSCIGLIIQKLEVKIETTPLQLKLEQIAEDIGKMGTYVALLIVHVLLFRYFLEGLSKRGTDLFGGEKNVPANGLFVASLRIWLEYVIVGVAVIVVAVPEGLPLAVMISLAYSIKRMLQDNNDVKRLASCEIMGGADNICSDKTGTLTLNMMKVTNIWAGKDIIVSQELDNATKKMSSLNWKNLFSNDIHPMHIEHNIACNTASKPGATDKSMNELIERCGTDEKALQAKHLTETLIRFPFSSKRKRMSTILENIQTKNSYGKRLHIKGASEIVKNCCSHYLDVDGNVKEINDEMNGHLDNVINNYARQALRTICLAYKDLIPNECGAMHDNPKDEDVKDIEKSGLTLICIFGIMDIVRPEVPGAVKIIQNAGVTVRMVTGDNIVTARAIAVLCNIISPTQIDDERCCMEGPEFYEKMGGLVVRNDKEEVGNYKLFKELMPHMKVMARARPMDKYLMVTGLRQMGAVVAVTGDGTNDAPALKKADVGFAMGITGTDVCKQAADILITDDNFSSIVKACMWGRNVYDNIQRFLQFQLTVNVGALILVFVGSALGEDTPLKAIQLLWVNLIMDSLGALALATELPKQALLERMPQNKDDYIVSRKMIKHILSQAIWQVTVLFVFLFGGEFIIPESRSDLQYDRQTGFVYPGRAKDWQGKELYTAKMDMADGASRHFTFIFTAFVMMQLFNMICSRKVHDEFNIFEGMSTNPTFIILWFACFGGQVLITQFGSRVFSCSPYGLDGKQWAICFGIGLTSLVVDVIIKFIPDWLFPKLGKDSVDDRRREASLMKKTGVASS